MVPYQWMPLTPDSSSPSSLPLSCFFSHLPLFHPCIVDFPHLPPPDPPLQPLLSFWRLRYRGSRSRGQHLCLYTMVSVKRMRKVKRVQNWWRRLVRGKMDCRGQKKRGCMVRGWGGENVWRDNIIKCVNSGRQCRVLWLLVRRFT